MSEIPDDIMQAASKLLDTLQWDIDSADADRERIARAILAERERCAKVVKAFRKSTAHLVVDSATFVAALANIESVIGGGSHE